MATHQSRTALRNRTAKALHSLHALRGDKRDIEEIISSVQSDTLAGIEGLEIKSFSAEYPDDGFTLTGTRVQTTSVSLDAEQLKKKVGAKMWTKISSRSLDSAKLESAIANGEISPKVVAACSTESKNKPYIRINAKPMK